MEVITQSMFTSRRCPNCDSDNATLERRAEHPADELPFSSLREHWFGFFKVPMFFDYYRCLSCGLLYNRKFFSESALSTLYATMPDNSGGEDTTLLKKTQLQYFEFLRKNTLTKGNFLELGPDVGLFTQYAAKSGLFENLYLVEPNKAVHDRLIANLNFPQTHLVESLSQHAQIPNESIDVAVVIHVLDHLLNPEEVIDTIHKKLKFSGLLLVVTHDESSLLAKLFKARWPGHCLQHPHLFNLKSTEDFMKRRGFELVAKGKSKNYFSLAFLLKHLFWALKLGRLQPPRILNFAIPLRLGNIMSVYRKRPEGNRAHA